MFKYKIKVLRILLAALFAVMYTLSGYAMDVYEPAVDIDETFTITYVDRFKPARKSGYRILSPRLSKQDRYSARSGIIKVDYVVDTLPDNHEKIVACMDYAKSIWQKIIQDSLQFTIKLMYKNQDKDDITTEVSYKKGKGVSYPMSYIAPQSRSVAGTIIVNPSSNWDYSTGDNMDSDKKNLCFALLRAIGRIMGFGSSIKINSIGKYYFFAQQYHTNFENLVYRSDGVALSSHRVVGNVDGRWELDSLTNFVNAPGYSFYIKDNKNEYELAEGPYTAANPPLTALADGLMCPEIAVGDAYLSVDDDTWRVMELLGWEVRKSNNTARIQYDDDNADESGILDPYISHCFSIPKPIQQLEKIKWTLYLPLKDGREYKFEVAADCFDCEVPPVTEVYPEEELYVNSDGIIPARLEFSWLRSDVPLKLHPYRIFYEAKPRIAEARITNITISDDDFYYKADYEVEYSGAESIEVLTEEEFTPISRTWEIHEPGFAKGSTAWMIRDGYAWIGFRAVNNGYKAVYMIEIEPGAENWYPLENPEMYLSPERPSGIMDLRLPEAPSKIRAYDLTGNLVWEGTDMNGLEHSGHKGIIIVAIENDNEVKVIKRFIK